MVCCMAHASVILIHSQFWYLKFPCDTCDNNDTHSMRPDKRGGKAYPEIHVLKDRAPQRPKTRKLEAVQSAASSLFSQ